MSGVFPRYKGKRAFVKVDQVKEKEWDTIIIGTGIGGMSCGAALAKMGHRVLMLEQHYLPGGYTHMFARKGYEWDVGVHAIGEQGPDNRGSTKYIFRWLSND